MKIAYLVHFRGGSESGILRKVASQVAAWTYLGAEVGVFVATSPAAVEAWRALPATVVVRTPPDGPMGLLRERESLVHDLERWRPELVYLRHGLVYPSLIRLAGRLPCVVEINGDDLSEFRLTSARRYQVARVTRGLLLRRAAGLVFVTHELAARPSFARYGRPGIVIGNGIDLASVEPAPVAHNERPTLIFVGHAHTPWHGVDQVVALAMAFPDWHIDLVGPGLDEIRTAAPNLTAHGSLEPSGYRQLLFGADVAVGSLALYRTGLHEASTLKVREYLAAGLPAIIGYRDTDFPDDVPFLLRVPNTENGIALSLPAIEGFVTRWQGRRVARELVANIDTDQKERKRLAFMASMVGA